MPNESNNLQWKAGYCPLCNLSVIFYTDQTWVKCPNCQHHVSLHLDTTIAWSMED